jgi:uncharacterized protein YutE (UPF0331/DUF86 family)
MQRSISRETLATETREQRAVERTFELAIQACADLAKHVATANFGYRGDAPKGAIRSLSADDVIDESTAETLVAAVGFRNILAHEYGSIDYDEVYDLLQNELGVYDSFSQQIAAWYQDQTER